MKTNWLLATQTCLALKRLDNTNDWIINLFPQQTQTYWAACVSITQWPLTWSCVTVTQWPTTKLFTNKCMSVSLHSNTPPHEYIKINLSHKNKHNKQTSLLKTYSLTHTQTLITFTPPHSLTYEFKIRSHKYAYCN